MIFHPARTDIQYVFDEDMQKIAQSYEDCGNRAGFLSLISVSYNVDTFSSADGLYGKAVLQIPKYMELSKHSQLFAKVFHALQNHIHLQEGQKIKVDLLPNTLPSDTNVPPSVEELWMKANVEYKGRITQHIFFGVKGNSKKVHVFRRVDESPTYEQTLEHHPPDIGPFKQIVGVVVKDGITHTFRICPEETQSNKESSQEGADELPD